MRDSTSMPTLKTKIRNMAQSDGQACCLRPRGGVQLSQEALRWGLPLQWSGMRVAHTDTHTHTNSHTHKHTGKKVAFDRAAARTGQLCSSDSTGHCLINTLTCDKSELDIKPKEPMLCFFFKLASVVCLYRFRIARHSLKMMMPNFFFFAVILIRKAARLHAPTDAQL